MKKKSLKTRIRDLKTQTQLTSEDELVISKDSTNDSGVPGVSERRVEEDVEKINPDPDSMESRG